jgi:hypothetical protein
MLLSADRACVRRISRVALSSGLSAGRFAWGHPPAAANDKLELDLLGYCTTFQGNYIHRVTESRLLLADMARRARLLRVPPRLDCGSNL